MIPRTEGESERKIEKEERERKRKRKRKREGGGGGRAGPPAGVCNGCWLACGRTGPGSKEQVVSMAASSWSHLPAAVSVQ